MQIYYQFKSVQLAAVEQSGLLIEYINNPTEAVQLAAAQQILNSIKK